jgi:hypothetical protein
MDLSEKTRRAILKGTAGTLGVAATAGVGSAHDWNSGDSGGSNSKFFGNGDNPNSDPENIGKSKNSTPVGYHGLGHLGPEKSTEEEAESPHFGGLTEISIATNKELDRDFAYVGMFSSKEGSGSKGMAVIDVTEYTRASAACDLEAASMDVKSFFANNNKATAIMDIKPTEDGDFVFLGTQPITLLFNEVSTSDPETEPGSGTNTGGVVAVDVSDPENPTATSTFDLFSTGIHNGFSHKIDGTDYYFGNKDIENAGDAGLYVFELNRSLPAPQLEPVNYYNVDGDTGDGFPTAASGGAAFYCHDNEVIDDPKTGNPTLYLAYWNSGIHALDVRDPTDITQIGQFEMDQAHFTTPAPELIDGKRVVVASHEEPSNTRDDGNEDKTNPNSTGTVFLVDADGIWEEDGVTQMGELDNWTWKNAANIEGKEDIEFDNFELSPHNSDIGVHEVNGEKQFWIHQAHYHLGVRYLKITPGQDDGLVGDARESGQSGIHKSTDWEITEEGFSRPFYDVPTASTLEGLTTVTPNMWMAEEANGVTFTSDINQGVHAIHYDAFPVGDEDSGVAVDVAGNGEIATDPDCDGLYENVNGDDKFDVVDVQGMFSNRNSGAVRNNVGAFDFNRNGRTNIVDVQKLFVEALGGSETTSMGVGTVLGGGALYRYRDAARERLGGLLGRED